RDGLVASSRRRECPRGRARDQAGTHARLGTRSGSDHDATDPEWAMATTCFEIDSGDRRRSRLDRLALRTQQQAEACLGPGLVALVRFAFERRRDDARTQVTPAGAEN